MSHRFSALAFTPTVKRLQLEQGSRAAYARMESVPEDIGGRLTQRESEFIAARDSFYMATVGETGWPYVQHRGGPAGFVRILDERTLGFADVRGNRQYVSVGNLSTDDRVSLFFMDYPNRNRLKLLGRAKLVGLEDRATIDRLAIAGDRDRVERGIVITVEAFDWNCPKQITPRYTLAEIQDLIDPLKQRIAELEAERAGRSR